MLDNSLAISAFKTRDISAMNKKPSLDEAKLKEQTDAFEAFMIKEVLDVALKQDESSSLFPKSAGSDIYKSMQVDAYSRALSGGFGFSAILFDFLKQRA